MKLNQNIILCLAKLAKSSVIKEISLINQRKTYAKRISVNKSLLFVHIQPTEFNLGSADFPGWWQWIIMNKVVPLPYGTDQATTCHPSGCAYRQLRCCKL